MDTGLYAIGFSKTFVSTKCKQNIRTQRKRPKKEMNSSCSFYKTIKCNINVNDSNKNVNISNNTVRP